MTGHPINYGEILASVALALGAHEDISKDTASDITETVEQACVSNDGLMSRDDYDEFMSVLDGVLDSIDGNGYSEEVEQLDAIRQRLESGSQPESAAVPQ